MKILNHACPADSVLKCMHGGIQTLAGDRGMQPRAVGIISAVCCRAVTIVEAVAPKYGAELKAEGSYDVPKADLRTGQRRDFIRFTLMPSSQALDRPMMRRV